MRRTGVLHLALAAGITLAGACAAPRQLYRGPALPREQVALLRGMPDFPYRDGRPGAKRTPAGRGTVVPIGLDGEIFNERVHSAYSGDAFLVLPGRHALLAYCEFSTIGEGPVRVLYSDLFTLEFTARAGGEYRYEAEFALGGGRWIETGAVVARPGVWDVTGSGSVGAAGRVGGDGKPVQLTHRTLTHIQAQVRER